MIDSRTIMQGTVVRRRRVCAGCDERFTTYESLVAPLDLDRRREQARRAAEQLEVMAAQLLKWGGGS